MRGRGFTPWFFLLAGILALSLVYCGKAGFTDEDLEESGQSVAEELAALDQALEGMVSRDLPGAGRAGPCVTSAKLSGCNTADGTRTRTFDACTILGTVWNGTVTLDFTDVNCKLAGDGDAVVRSPDFTITGRRNASITVSAAKATTWDGTEVEGGQKLTRTGATTFTFEVLGVTRSGKVGNTEIFNVSRKTTEPLAVTGNNRLNRTVNGGKLVAYHNLAEFNVEWVPNNVKWADTCKCPLSGSLTGTLSGSREGTLTITFPSCGKAVLTRGEETMEISLDSCESTG